MTQEEYSKFHIPKDSLKRKREDDLCKSTTRDSLICSQTYKVVYFLRKFMQYSFASLLAAMPDRLGDEM
jgi:hypothetical protein